MRGIKRAGAKRGKVLGHRFGVGSDVLLGYRDARHRIYLPAYRWVLENRLAAGVGRAAGRGGNDDRRAFGLRDQWGCRGLVPAAVACCPDQGILGRVVAE